MTHEPSWQPNRSAEQVSSLRQAHLPDRWRNNDLRIGARVAERQFKAICGPISGIAILAVIESASSQNLSINQIKAAALCRAGTHFHLARHRPLLRPAYCAHLDRSQIGQIGGCCATRDNAGARHSCAPAMIQVQLERHYRLTWLADAYKEVSSREKLDSYRGVRYCFTAERAAKPVGALSLDCARQQQQQQQQASHNGLNPASSFVSLI